MRFSTKILKNVGMCLASGFATQTGMMLARKLFEKFDKKDVDETKKKPIGFTENWVFNRLFIFFERGMIWKSF